jgi:hypothetical protein
MDVEVNLLSKSDPELAPLLKLTAVDQKAIKLLANVDSLPEEVVTDFVLAVPVERVLDPKVVGLLIELLTKVDPLPEEVLTDEKVTSKDDWLLVLPVVNELSPRIVGLLIELLSKVDPLPEEVLTDDE